MQLYTEDMKPIHASERFFEASDRNRKIAKGEIYSSSAVKLNELSSVGLLFLELIIKLISETRRSIGDLRHVVEVIFKSPPDER